MNRYEDMLRRQKTVNDKFTGPNGKPIDPKAQALFNKPANFCQFCGEPIEENPSPIEGKWERKWSTHWECKDAVGDMLDRQVGIKSERKDKNGQA